MFLNNQLTLTFFALFIIAFASATDGPDLKLFSGVASSDRPNDSSFSWSQEYGLMNHQFNINMKPDAQFWVGSNSKLFTTVAIYQLFEKGRFNVNDNVADHLDADDFKAFGYENITKWCPKLLESDTCEKVTFVQLMSMSSGLLDSLNCDYPAGSPYRAYCDPTGFYMNHGSVALMVGRFIGNPLTFVPGTSYSYANPNFILLTYIIEKFSQMSYRDYIQENILNVIAKHSSDPQTSMTSTTFDPFNQQFNVFPGKTGEFYNYRDPTSQQIYATGECTLELNPAASSGTGGILSNQQDMKDWYRALFVTKPSPLLTAESITSIIAPHTQMSEVNPSLYYSQGVVTKWLNTPPIEQLPNVVLYQGGTICCHTAIMLAGKDANSTIQDDPYLITAFRNVNEVFVDPASHKKAQSSSQGTFFSLAAGWKIVSDALTVANQVYEYFISNTDLLSSSHSSHALSTQELEFLMTQPM